MSRLSKGSWEKDGSLFESKYHVIASSIANQLDNSAIKQNRRYTKDTHKEVADKLTQLYGIKFKASSVGVYLDATSTDEAFINKDLSEPRVARYHKQIKQLRKVLLSIK
jgi:hypothetical protein